MKNKHLIGPAVLLLCNMWSQQAKAQGTAFDYQGRLTDNGVAVSGTYDLRFSLYSDAAGTTQVGSTFCSNDTTVAGGLFKVALDFGTGSLPGDGRWLKIEVRPGAAGDCLLTTGFTALNPLRKINSSPYSSNADRLDNLNSTDLMVKSIYDADSNNQIDSAALQSISSLSASDGTPPVVMASDASGRIVAGEAGLYNGGTLGSYLSSFTKQMVLAGNYNAAPNIGNTVKLLVADYDNDDATKTIFPIYCEDENNVVDFALSRVGHRTRAFFNGRVDANGGVGLGGPGASFLQYNSFYDGMVVGTDVKTTIAAATVTNAFAFGGPLWQSFTANADVTVSAIDVMRTTDSGGPPGNMLMRVYTGEGLGGTLLGQTTLVAATEEFHWQRCTFVPEIKVSNGFQYTIAMIQLDGETNWKCSTLNPYAGGRSAFGDPNVDMCFRVHVKDGGTIDHMLVKNDGKVGVGTMTPLNKMDVAGSMVVGAGYGGTNTAPANGMLIEGNVGIGTASFDNELAVAGGVAVGPNFAEDAENMEGGMAVEGNLLVGTTSNIGKLGVDGGAFGQFLVAFTSSDLLGTIINFSNTSSGGTNWSFKNQGNFNANPGSLEISANATPVANLMKNGNVGIGRVPTTNRFEVEGEASKSIPGGFASNSDARIKTDVKAINDPLATMRDLRPVSYRYTPEYLAAHPSIDDKVYYNVIAQEFSGVFPEYVKPSGELVPGTGEAILQVDTNPMAITAVAAIQELDSKVNALEQQNADLRKQLQEMSDRMSALESPAVASTK